jgi:hypothetical protein
VRLLRVRGRRRRHDVWLATDVSDRGRLTREQAARLYRWRWERGGFFRTNKRTLRKVKLVSRTVALVHREAEGSLLAAQLLLAQGAAADPARACSPRGVLLAVRSELRQAAAAAPRGGSFGRRVAAARREQRVRRSAKEKRVWPRRAPHQPPKPPRLLALAEVEIARIPLLQRKET